jgi:hypothetical protein
MLFPIPLISCTLTLLAPPTAPTTPAAVVADKNVITRGQSVTLRWYFTGQKVVVAGGRFGKGQVVTGRTSLTDHPLKTTRYTFDVWYRGEATSPETKQRTIMPLHAHYTVLVEVESGVTPGLASYQDRFGWQIHHLAGWKHDSVPLSDPQNNALIFFQQEDDSVERLAVSILPAQDMTCKELMQKVQASLYSSYDEVQVLTQTEATYVGVPAQWATFTGKDHSHPGTRTQSLVLAFVRDGHAYVISARTAADHYGTRETLLRKMVTSFTFTAKSPSFRNAGS